VKGEAEAIGEHSVAREAYFDPTIGPVSQGNIYIGEHGEYMRKHPAGDKEYARVAELKALSANLMYLPSELLAVAAELLDRKWARLG